VQIIYRYLTCTLTILIVSLFSLFLCFVIHTILVRPKRDLYEHFFGKTNAGGVVTCTTTGYRRRMQGNHRNGQEESDIVATSGPYTRLRKNRLKIVFLISLTNFR